MNAPFASVSSASTHPEAAEALAAIEQGVVKFNGTFDTQNKEGGGRYSTVTWRDIQAMAGAPTAVAKERAPAIIPSTYIEHDARCHEVQRERGEFVMLAVDIDKGSPSLEKVIGAMEAIVGSDVGFLAYSSASASPDVLKWRVIIPLQEPLPGDEYSGVQKALFSLLADQGITCDGMLAGTGQPVFLPNVPPTRRGADGAPLFYTAFQHTGRPLELSPGSAIVERCAELYRRERLAREQAATEAEQRRQKRLAFPPSDETTPTQWFNDNNSVEALLLRYGYISDKRGNWLSPHQKSGSFATTITADGKAFISFSASDREKGLGAIANGGQCIYGDAYDLFCHYEHGNDHKQAWSAISEMMPSEPSAFERMAARGKEAPPSGTDSPGRTHSEEAKATADAKANATAEASLPLWDPWREPAVPTFPTGVLPDDVAQYVQERGTETGACRSAIAMSCLAVTSGALTHEARLYLKPGQNFAVSPRLWVLLVGDPSAKKSPAMDGAVKPLVAHQRAVQGAQMAAWRAEQEAEEGKGKKKRSPPELTHFLVHDTTPEMLAEVLSRQDRGVLLNADELAGWLGALDRYASGKGASSSRAIWLQAYNGGPFTLLRVTRETLPVNNLSASILGGIQPERLREIGGLTSDGLLQRFLPVMMAKPQIDRDGFSTAAFRAWDERVRSLLGYSRFATELSPEAREERKRVAQLLFDLGQGDSEGAGWQGFVGKLPGVWGNLALLLHVLWGYRAADPVALETAQRASKLLEEFVLPHGLSFYRSLVGTGQADARAIAGFLAGWDQRTISIRDFVRGPRCCRALTPEEIASKLAPFEAGGWLEPEKAGPWNRKWALMPGLGARFGEELARHRATVAAIQARIIGGRDDED